MNKQAVNTKGVLTGEIRISGYGPRFVVYFDRTMPHIVNRGLNVYECVNMDIVELDKTPDLLHTSNDSGFRGREMGHFCGWIVAKFTNGETPLFINHHASAYDSNLKRYTAPVFSVSG